MESEIKISFHPKFDKGRRGGREQPTTTKTKMEGKNFTLKFLLWLILSLWLTTTNTLSSLTKDPPKLRGGLVFVEEHQDDPLYINQEYYTLTRTIDTQPLITGTSVLQTILNKYKAHCQSVKEATTPDTTTPAPTKHKAPEDDFIPDPSYELFVTESATQIGNAISTCKRLGGYLPEMRNAERRERIRRIANLKDITIMAAGLHFDSSTSSFRYNSDDAHYLEATTSFEISYGGSYGSADHRASPINSYVLAEAVNHPMGYKDIKTNPYTRILSKEEMIIKQKIICERKTTNKTDTNETNNKNAILLLTHHNCQRDLPLMVEQLKTSLTEIQSIIPINLNATNNNTSATLIEDKYFPQIPQRYKRAIPFLLPLIGTTAGSNMIYSAVHGGSPLSWVGSAAAAIFGLSSQSDLQQLTKRMDNVDSRIDTLSINDEETQNIIKAIKSRLDEITQLVLEGQVSTVASIIEQDLKNMFRQQVHILETATLKYTSIFTASMSGKTSPYALTTNEITKTAQKLDKTRHIQIDTDFRHISSIISINESTIDMYFRVPITDPDKLFTLYRIQSLPVYVNNKTFLPELDGTYIGISKSNSEYIILTEDEYSKCSINPRECHVASPIIPMSKDQHCTISTYTQQTLKCPLIEKDIEPRTEFINQGCHTIYSTHQPTKLYVKCERSNMQSHKFWDETTTINGIGELTFREGCTITAEGGTKWTTTTIFNMEKLDNVKHLFGNVRSFPIPKDITLRFITKDDLTPIPTPQFKEVQQPEPSLQQIAAASFGFKQYITFLIQIASILGGILILLLCTFCGIRKCRQIFGPLKWCPWITPTPERTNTRLSKLTEKLDTIEQSLSNNMKSFSDSNWSLKHLSLPKYTSMPTLSRNKFTKDDEDTELQSMPHMMPILTPKTQPKSILKEPTLRFTPSSDGLTYTYTSMGPKITPDTHSDSDTDHT